MHTGTRPVPKANIEELSERFKRLKGINPGANTPRKPVGGVVIESTPTDGDCVRVAYARVSQNPSFKSAGNEVNRAVSNDFV